MLKDNNKSIMQITKLQQPTANKKIATVNVESKNKII